MEFNGIVFIIEFKVDSVKVGSERLMIHMFIRNSLAKAWISEDFPVPGGPSNKYVRRYGMHWLRYNELELKNNFMSWKN
jgi:hypothetical protein